MTARIIPFKRPPTQFSLGCPKCGGNSGTLNLRSQHFGICEQHKLKWCIGVDLPFLGWRHENEQIWYANAVTLQSYQEVQPAKKWKPCP